MFIIKLINEVYKKKKHMLKDSELDVFERKIRLRNQESKILT